MIINDGAINTCSKLSIVNSVDKYSGLTLSFICTCAFTFGEFGYVKNNLVYKFDNTVPLESSEYMSKYKLVVCLSETVLINQSGLFLLDGVIDNSTWSFDLSADRSVMLKTFDGIPFQCNTPGWQYDRPYTCLSYISAGIAISVTTLLFKPRIVINRVARQTKYVINNGEFGIFSKRTAASVGPILLKLTSSCTPKIATLSSLYTYESQEAFNENIDMQNISFIILRISNPEDGYFADRIIYSQFYNIDIESDLLEVGFKHDQIYTVKLEITDVFNSINYCEYKFIIYDEPLPEELSNIFDLSSSAIRQIGGEDVTLLSTLYTPTYNVECDIKQRLLLRKIKDFQNVKQLTINTSQFAKFNPSIKIEHLSDTRGIVVIRYNDNDLKYTDSSNPYTTLKLIYIDTVAFTIISEHIIDIEDLYISKTEPNTLNSGYNCHPRYFNCDILTFDTYKHICSFSHTSNNCGFYISNESDIIEISPVKYYMFDDLEIRHVSCKIINNTTMAFVGVYNSILKCGTCTISMTYPASIPTITLTNIRMTQIESQISKSFYNHSFVFLNTLVDNKISILCSYLKEVGKGFFTPFIVKCVLDTVGPADHVIGPILEIPTTDKTTCFNSTLFNFYGAIDPIRLVYYKLNGTNPLQSGLYYYTIKLAPDGTSFELNNEYEYEWGSVRSSNGITSNLFTNDYAQVSSNGDLICINDYIKRTAYPPLNQV